MFAMPRRSLVYVLLKTRNQYVISGFEHYVPPRLREGTKLEDPQVPCQRADSLMEADELKLQDLQACKAEEARREGKGKVRFEMVMQSLHGGAWGSYPHSVDCFGLWLVHCSCPLDGLAGGPQSRPLPGPRFRSAIVSCHFVLIQRSALQRRGTGPSPKGAQTSVARL
jgi:hypothetical protein